MPRFVSLLGFFFVFSFRFFDVALQPVGVKVREVAVTTSSRFIFRPRCRMCSRDRRSGVGVELARSCFFFILLSVSPQSLFPHVHIRSACKHNCDFSEGLFIVCILCFIKFDKHVGSPTSLSSHPRKQS